MKAYQTQQRGPAGLFEPVCQSVDVALDSVDLPTIRRFARKSFRYMDLYRQGITGKLAEYACKKFRRIDVFLRMRYSLFWLKYMRNKCFM